MCSYEANDEYKQFGYRLRKLRETTGLSQAAFADLFNMPQQTYQGYESGIRKITLPTLRKLSSYFSVSIDFLVGNNSVSTEGQKDCAALTFNETSAPHDASDNFSFAERELFMLWHSASSLGQDAAKAVLIAHKKSVQ